MLGRLQGGIIGLDVDRSAIKAVQLTGGPDGYVLQHVGYHQLPEGLIEDGEVVDGEALSREIREFWDLHSFRGKSVILGVAGRNVIVRFVPFPRLSPEDLASALNFHAEEYIPMPIDDVVLDYVVLGPSAENPEEDQVLLVAARKDLVSGYTSALRAGGLRPAGVDVKALSLTRSSLPDALFDDEETTLLLDIGTEVSNLVISQGRTPTLAQFLSFGFKDFVRSVGEAADLDADEAEKQTLNRSANLGPAPLDEEPGSSEDDTQALESLPPEAAEQTTPLDASKENEPEVEGESSASEEGSASSPQEPPGSEGRRTDSSEEASSSGEDAGLPPDPALMFDVRRGLEAASDRLAEEVRRSVEYHDSRPRSREVTKVVISGEGALIPGLGAHLADLLGLPTWPARPSAKLVSNRSNISDEQLAAMEPVLAVALGLAMEE